MKLDTVLIEHPQRPGLQVALPGEPEGIDYGGALVCGECGRKFYLEREFVNHSCIRYPKAKRTRQRYTFCERCQTRFANGAAYRYHLVPYGDEGVWCHLPEELGMISTGTTSGWVLPGQVDGRKRRSSEKSGPETIVPD